MLAGVRYRKLGWHLQAKRSGACGVGVHGIHSNDVWHASLSEAEKHALLCLFSGGTQARPVWVLVV